MSLHSQPTATRANCLRLFSPSKLLPCTHAKPSSSSLALPHPSLKPSSSPPARRLWLDELPLDVCARIAAYVSRSDHRQPSHYQPRSALHLAEVSPLMCLAVLSALRHTLTFPTGHDLRWAAVFRSHIRVLILAPPRPILHRPAASWRHLSLHGLLRSPTLRAAAIANAASDLRAAADAPNLRELCVVFSQRAPMRAFWAALRRLDLRVLRLVCPVAMSPTCVCRHLLAARSACTRLAARCRALQELEVACSCNDAKADLAPLLAALPNLRALTMNKTVVASALPFLRTLDSVTLRYGARPPSRDTVNSMAVQLEQAVRIGAAVTAIESVEGRCSESISVIDADGVAQLARCPRLRRLDMCIEDGAERSFPELSDLEALRLCWDNALTQAGAWGGRGKVARYATPVAGFLPRVVESAPALREVCLFDARISLDELVGMLRTIGERLEVFGTSIMGQAKRPQEHCLGVIEAATRYNPSLVRLVLKVYRCDGRDERIRGVGLHWRRRILKAMGLLQRRAALVDIEMGDGLQEWLYERAYDYSSRNSM